MTEPFEHYLQQFGEVGHVEGISGAIITVVGLPSVSPYEIVLFEKESIGVILTLAPDSVEVMQLSAEPILVGTRVARTKRTLSVTVGDHLLGKTIWIEREKHFFVFDDDSESRQIENTGKPFHQRRRVEKPLETGVTIVDLIVPLGKGQRQLVIGDRKSGKTNFLLQTLQTQVAKGSICIYVGIAKPQMELSRLEKFLSSDEQLHQNTILVASSSADRPGLIYFTPYVAMTYAEYFRDQGKDVVIIFDDLTAHAKYYREVMLLAKRFPGRSSYPSDIFYIHSRLLERGGNFDTGSISCLPVAQSVLGDLSGYIQSNIMSMTDGHIFFDSDLFDQGRRPAVNPFLSVTRVGEQTQTPLVREVSRHLRAFLMSYEKMKQFKHFQTELGDNVRTVFEKGARVLAFLDQFPDAITPLEFNIFFYASLWTDFWDAIPVSQLKKEHQFLLQFFQQDKDFQRMVNELLQASPNFTELTQQVKQKEQLLLAALQSVRQQTEAAPQ